MRATIAYYDPPRRPTAEERPDFTALPLTGKPVTVVPEQRMTPAPNRNESRAFPRFFNLGKH